MIVVRVDSSIKCFNAMPKGIVATSDKDILLQGAFTSRVLGIISIVATSVLARYTVVAPVIP